jgi:hypothetical protein
MFCWGVYLWDGPNVCRVRTVKTVMGHARPLPPAALVRRGIGRLRLLVAAIRKLGPSSLHGV